jgi:glycosyltransferase involved in cell wall biosynthesis
VVPAFNAAETIHETLVSISKQTYGRLEVIVVDDGSTDATAEIVRRHRLADSRVRLVQKANGGVASARNEGIRASRGDFVAFIDADDLWYPTKIAKQVELLSAGGESMALVYSPFRVIDRNGNVIASPRRLGVSGWVLYRHFHVNLIGNGSSILVRRDVLEELGGFDLSLREAGAEGCEDLLLQLRIAAHYQFGEIPEYLVGYRRRPESMSSNVEQMLRSGALAMCMALSECRNVPGLSADAILNRYQWQRLRNAARNGQVAVVMRHLWHQVRDHPGLAAAACWNDLVLIGGRASDAAQGELARRLDRLRPTSGSARHFYDFDPTAGVGRTRRTPFGFRRLACLDQSYRPASRIMDDSRRVCGRVESLALDHGP